VGQQTFWVLGDDAECVVIDAPHDRPTRSCPAVGPHGRAQPAIFVHPRPRRPCRPAAAALAEAPPARPNLAAPPPEPRALGSDLPWTGPRTGTWPTGKTITVGRRLTSTVLHTPPGQFRAGGRVLFHLARPGAGCSAATRCFAGGTGREPGRSFLRFSARSSTRSATGCSSSIRATVVHPPVHVPPDHHHHRRRTTPPAGMGSPRGH